MDGEIVNQTCIKITFRIPEIIKPKDMQNSVHLWLRLVQNFEENNILLAFGTNIKSLMDKIYFQVQESMNQQRIMIMLQNMILIAISIIK